PDITSWHEFLHYLHEFTAFCTDFHAVTKQSQMHQNTTKDQWGGLGAFVAKKSRRHFVARTLALIAPIYPILHRVSCSYEMIPNAPKHYETHQNMSLGSNGVDQVRLLGKITT